jgi:hypothetical protein
MTKRFCFLFLFGVMAQFVTGTLPALGAGRACVDNFSQSGQSFETFIETKGDSNKVLTVLAKKVAADGFLGMSVSKDVGIITAYQETGGAASKKSSITVTVSQLKAGKLKIETSFVMAAGLRATKAAVLGFMCDMLEATLPEDERKKLAADTSSAVVLKSDGVEKKLGVMVGTHRHISLFLVLLFYRDFPGATAEERTKDPKPVLTVPTKDDPAKSYFLVKLESDTTRNGMRSLKILSAGSILSSATSGKGSMDPDSDWTFPFSTKLEGDGRWSVSPLNNLEPGEYGLYDAENGALSAFGIDKAP